MTIYFVRAAGTKFVKIGFTSGDPLHRLRSLQTGSPHPLELLAVMEGTEQSERRFHAEFASRRRRGEWFELSDGDVSAVPGVSMQPTATVVFELDGSERTVALPSTFAEWHEILDDHVDVWSGRMYVWVGGDAAALYRRPVNVKATNASRDDEVSAGMFHGPVVRVPRRMWIAPLAA